MLYMWTRWIWRRRGRYLEVMEISHCLRNLEETILIVQSSQLDWSCQLPVLRLPRRQEHISRPLTKLWKKVSLNL
ncbi:wsv263 [White spot syndrome virus]|uniref:Wsv263 n=4 Tax=White spot syndrome virus TaxID=342409 RepID=Q8VAW2_WSSVS|nr:wsv263 [Shrimp white spot syndrome virus]AFX59637.1 wsv263 [White spot syndrome virus]AAL33266.1 wsv263 [Shrimp white spot syndrome virus]AAL89186.1 WSSV318 [Shrimp white spot syndrome virus]AWQ60840.1 wsv263 [Shrimp white spot syndrome virus]AWQ61698.1 wsv263 [Shrimp white spot syndrome virus]